jgi:PadR family transcriptional regulator PadR
MMYYMIGGIGLDIQLKRGLLDVCVLAAIKDEDSYGYKIIKDMKPFIELSESTLYTILKRLEGADMLTVRTAEHGGRLRKYYHITENGLNRIEEFKDDWKEILSIYRFVTKEGDGNA